MFESNITNLKPKPNSSTIVDSHSGTKSEVQEFSVVRELVIFQLLIHCFFKEKEHCYSCVIIAL